MFKDNPTFPAYERFDFVAQLDRVMRYPNCIWVCLWGNFQRQLDWTCRQNKEDSSWWGSPSWVGHPLMGWLRPVSRMPEEKKRAVSGLIHLSFELTLLPCALSHQCPWSWDFGHYLTSLISFAVSPAYTQLTIRTSRPSQLVSYISYWFPF